MKKERAARKERLALQVGIALTAGVFGAVPAAEGAPVVDKVVTAGTQVAQSGNVTDVTGTQANNIVKWKDFSVGKDETVRFDHGEKKKNYLNLVTGPNQSEIAGKIEGGRDVYLVNPHGVIFSHGAQVNVGNLYVSTENTEAALQAFNAGKTAGEVLTAGTANADVVNLGGIAASTVIVNGDNIRFLTDDVQATQVTLQATKNIVQEQNAARGAASARAYRKARKAGQNAARGYVLHAANTESRQAILDSAGLAAMNNNLSGSYSLETDLTLSGSYTPIGGNSYGAFTGKFDGNFHTISGIQVSGGTYGGLFGLTNGAIIQNVGVKDGSVTAVHAGGIVGKAVSTTLTDVYNAGVDITAIDNDTDYSGFSAGGIVGYAKNSKIGKVYNTGTVNGEGAGLIGCAESGTTLTNAYNTGVAHYAVVAYAPSSDTSNISYTYATQGLTHSEFYGGDSDTDTVFSVTSQDTKLKKYTDKNFDISDSGTDNTVWRIYEGHSLPLLRDFLRRGKGAVTVSYDYTQGSNSGSNNGSDLTLTYNNQDVKLSNINYTNANGLAIDKLKITQDTGSLRNANVYSENGVTSNGQQAFYCTSQDGYDLVGNNVYINQREVNISGDSVAGKHITKVYDGKVDASDAVKALFNASDTSVTGLIAGDQTATLNANNLKASFKDKNVGVGKTVTANGTLTLSQTAHNYKVTGSGTAQLNNVELSGDITPAKLTLSLADGKTLKKVYEGKANAATAETVSSLFSSDKTVTGLQKDDSGKTDDVTLGFQDNDAKGTYGTKHAGGTFTVDGSAGAHDVELTGIQLSGADAGNYNLIDASGNIIWGKNYTAGADATASGTFQDVGKTSGGTAYLTGTITKRNLTADGFTWYDGDTPHAVKDNTKEYDTTSDYTAANGKKVNKAAGLVSRDNVDFTVNGSGTHFVHATVADGKVTVSNDDAKTVKDANAIAYAVTVSGEDARNYTLNGNDIQDGDTATVYGEGKITPRTLFVGAAGGKVFEKTYDGDAALKTSDGKGTAANPFTLADGYLAYTGGDSHQLLNDGAKITYTGAYSDKDVARDASGKATTKSVTFTAQVKDQDGSASSNYVFLNGDSQNTTMDFTGKGIIDPAKITAVTLADVSKTYDGTADNTSATLKGAAGIVSGENYADILQTGTDSKYVVKNSDGSYQETSHVNATNARYTISLTNPRGNYDLALPQDADGHYLAYGKGTITPLTIKSITLHPVQNTEITKVYDSSDAVTHEENGQTVQADSYVSTLEADIPGSTSKLTFTQGAQSLGYTVADARFDEKNSHNGKKQGVTYYLDVTGQDGYNDYAFDSSLLENGKVKASYAPGGIITPKDVTPVIRRQDLTKVFDGTTDVVGASGAKLSGDALVDLLGVYPSDNIQNDSTAQYQNANVNRADNYPDGTGFVRYAYKLSGDTGENYRLTQTSGTGSGTITPRHLTATFSAVQKVYDGDTALVGTKDDKGLPTITLANRAEKDANKDRIGVTYTGAAYASPDVTDANYVKYTGVALTHNDAGNYVLDLTYLPGEAEKTVRGEGKITSAQVTKADITTLFDPITKIYDGNTNVAYDHTGDAAYDVDYKTGDAKSKTAADFLQDGDDAASGTQSIRIKGRALTYGKDYTIAADGGATYAGKDAGKHDVTYRFQLSGTVRRNYDFSQVLGDNSVFSGNDLLGKTQGTITRKTVTAALSGVTDVIEKKAYDGKTTLPDGTDVTNRVTFRGLLAGDAQLGKVTGVYNTKDVARNADGTVGTKDVLYTPSLDGTGAANYQLKLVSPEGAALTSTTLTGAGQGRILPRQLGFSAGYAEKTYDATPEAAVINPAFTGFADGESLTPGTADGAADGKSLVKAQYGLYDGTTFTPDENVEGKGAEPDFKAVAYTNLQQALQHASGQTGTIKASNYTIADTVYFDQAKQQGKIKRLALSAGDIKERWSSNIQKQYDGTTAVDLTDPEKNFQIYIDETTAADGTKLKLPKTVYLHYELDASKGSAQYNSKDVKNADAVTYHISGLKNSEKLANNFTFSDGGSLDLEKYKGDFTLKNGDTSGSGILVGDGSQKAVVGITKRVLRVHADGHNDKTYDGNAAADAGHLVLAGGTDGKSAQDIAKILQNDKTDLASHVVANYMATGAAQETAAEANVGAKHDASQGEGGKVVAYTVDLAKSGAKDLTANYALDTSKTQADGVTNQVTGDGTKGTYSGLGDILRRVVYVSFQDAQAENRKVYDGTTSVTDTADDRIRAFALSDEDARNKTGIIRQDQGNVSLTGATGTYDTAHVKRDASGSVLEGQHTVTYQGFALKNADGSDNTNYELAAADGRTDAQGNAVLIGKGTITPAALHVGLRDANVTQVYDNTRDVEDLAKYGEANIQTTDSDLKTVNNVRDTVNVKLGGTPQYDKKDANVIQGRKTENRSVTYELSWDNPDYELAVAQDAPSQTLDVTKEITSGGVGTARLVTDAALITPRTVTLAADPAKTATRLYDGASGGVAEHAIGNLEAGNLAKGEKLINLFLAPGATEESYLPETVLRSAYDSDPNAGRDGVAVAGDRNDLRAHTVTYTYTLQNPNYQLDATGRMAGTASGQGVIRRRDVTVTADPVSISMGKALPAFTGSTTGFVSKDGAVQTSFESRLQFRPEDGVVAPTVGTYGVYGWYRTQEEQEVTVPAVLDQDGKTVLTPAHTEKQLVDVWYREGNLGLNYYFQQDPGNDTALTVTRPTADWPRSLEEALVPAKQYVPDGNAYHRVSYDTYQETNRTPTAGIEYAAGGLNVGAAGAAAGKAAAAALEGGREVVNLGGTRAAVVDVTYPGAAEFVVSGARAVPGVTEAAWTKLAASEARGAAAALGGDAGRGAAGALATQAGSAASSAAGALAAQAGSGSSAAAGASSPAAASRGGAARNADVPLFYDMEERQPSRLASTAEAQLFGDAVPAAKEAAAAPVKLFADDGAAQHAAAGATAPARGAAPALFDDAAAAAAEQPSSDAIEVTTAPADEDDEQKEKEEAARAAALKAKGAAIGIESEGAGVNLAG